MAHSLEVVFHGATLLVVEHNNQPYAPMKPIVSGMGLAWQSQLAKLTGNAKRWGITEIVIPTTSGQQGMSCLPLYHFAVDTVMKHHLNFSKVYVLINLFAGTRSFQEMTKEQTAQVAEFCDRFALGNDTRNDWQRIADNQADLFGEPQQVDMVQKLMLT